MRYHHSTVDWLKQAGATGAQAVERKTLSTSKKNGSMYIITLLIMARPEREQFDPQVALRDPKFLGALRKQPDGESLLRAAFQDAGEARALEQRYFQFRELADTKTALVELFKHLAGAYQANTKLNFPVDAEMERVLGQAVEDREAAGNPIERDSLRSLCRGFAVVETEQAEFAKVRAALAEYGGGAQLALDQQVDKERYPKLSRVKKIATWWPRRQEKKALHRKLDTVRREQALDNRARQTPEQSWEQIRAKFGALWTADAIFEEIATVERESSQLSAALKKAVQEAQRLYNKKKQLANEAKALGRQWQELDQERVGLRQAEADLAQAKQAREGATIIARLDKAGRPVKIKQPDDGLDKKISENQTALSKNQIALHKNKAQGETNTQAREDNFKARQHNGKRIAEFKKAETLHTKEHERLVQQKEAELQAIEAEFGITHDEVSQEFARLSELIDWQVAEAQALKKQTAPLTERTAELRAAADAIVGQSEWFQGQIARQIEQLARDNPLQAAASYAAANQAEQATGQAHLAKVRVGRDEIDTRARDQVRQEIVASLARHCISPNFTVDSLEKCLADIFQENKLESDTATTAVVQEALGDVSARLARYNRMIRRAETELDRCQRDRQAQLAVAEAQGLDATMSPDYASKPIKETALKVTVKDRWQKALLAETPIAMEQAVSDFIPELIEAYARVDEYDTSEHSRHFGKRVPPAVRLSKQARVVEILQTALVEVEREMNDRQLIIEMTCQAWQNAEPLMTEEKRGLDVALARDLMQQHYPRVAPDRTVRETMSEPAAVDKKRK